jgi:uncharacterized SAM-binding protein YcdF (DUF218 family)
LRRPKYRRRALLLLFLTVTYIVYAYGDVIWTRYSTLHEDIRSVLMDDLRVNKIISEDNAFAANKSDSMIYILGGTQEDLKYHFRIASELYRKNRAEKVFVLSNPGNTEYSALLSRNLTNDEWSLRELARVGVDRSSVETVVVPWAPFGTYSEAVAISRLARERGYRRIILICADQHTRRVYLTFSRLLNGGPEIFVYGSNDNAGVVSLLVEHGKYFGYRLLLIPLSDGSGGEQLPSMSAPRSTGSKECPGGS